MQGKDTGLTAFEEAVIDWAADRTGVSLTDIVGRGRGDAITQARSIAIAALGDRGYSLSRMAPIFRRDRTTLGPLAARGRRLLQTLQTGDDRDTDHRAPRWRGREVPIPEPEDFPTRDTLGLDARLDHRHRDIVEACVDALRESGLRVSVGRSHHPDAPITIIVERGPLTSS